MNEAEAEMAFAEEHMLEQVFSAGRESQKKIGKVLLQLQSMERKLVVE